jgi:NAD(P)-dependent dehydrogenase (short-subunit alcohol dehydrogenase family)
MIVDLSDMSSVVHFCHNVRNKYSRLDILICNAGVYDTSGTRKTTKDGLELHFGTNYLSHYVMADMLLDLLKNGHDSR